MSTPPNLDEALRALDAARPLTTAQLHTARSTLDRILASDPTAPTRSTGQTVLPQPRLPERGGAQGPVAPERAAMPGVGGSGAVEPGLPAGGVGARAGGRRRVSRRLVLVSVAAAAALAGALVVVPGSVGGGRAYASWTPDPAPLTAAETALIGRACWKAAVRGLLDVRRSRVALAERRGEYAALLIRDDAATPQGPSMVATCLVHNVPGSDDVDDVKWGAASGVGAATVIPARGYSDGALEDTRDFSITEGAVGADVAELTIHARDLTTRATISGGRYVAWWPGPSFDHDAPGGPKEFLTYDVTLRDGTVIRDAPPSRG